ncbi:amino acid ABC transporter substrate-binding protein [Aestuariirhabdus litorea]|uniref:Leucine-binding protein domain-containing protein n=1 Tax=Aestuariirhabdus litorea TaxID=2528527 RepID=A0A3P3VR60_9GAMM|nr:amino acid ABC transporter substrate-binding protein [Aestuariirhabdus litorea]RRJ83313.1 hypothetical protein D0544_15945 [Aestuariirhabdus litorea]RWW93473.1 hypothetical protein DZC74_15915 [Endozoicomonadaceae bacterium GTF-13]
MKFVYTVLHALRASLALLLLATVPMGLAQGDEHPPIKVGVTASLSGNYQAQGQGLLEGLKMWVRDINARGSLLGRRVVLVGYDDESSPQKSAQLYERLIREDKVDLLVGPYASDLTLAASAVAEKFNIPMVSGTAASEEIWNQGFANIFQVDLPAHKYMVGGLEIARAAGIERVGILYQDSQFTRDVASGARAEAQQLGMEVVEFSSYSPNTRDFSDLVKGLRQQQAELVLGASYLDDSVAIVQELKRQNFSPRAVGFTSGPSLVEFGERLGADAEGVLGFTPWLRAAREPMAYDFDFRYRQLYGRSADSNSAGGYAAGEVLEAAVRLAGSLEQERVREQLRNMSFLSIVGRYQVDEKGMQVGKSMYILQWQNGHRALVLPARYAEVKSQPFQPWDRR